MFARAVRSVVLALVLQAAAPAAIAADWIYVVRPGDNPWTLTERYLAGVRFWPLLQRYNDLRDPQRIPPGTVLRVPEAWLRAEPAAVQVATINREAWVVRAADTRPEPLAPSASIYASDRVRTAPDATLELRFADGSRIRVLGDSELRIQRHVRYANTDMFDTRVELMRGRTENLPRAIPGTAGRFEIQTPAAVTSVRGTRFRVGAADGQSTTETLEGRVQVANSTGGTVLGPATGTVAVAGQAPSPPVPLLPPPDLSALPDVVERTPIAFRVPPLADAVAYRLQVASDPSFATVLHDAVSASPVVQAMPLADGDYHVLVRGIDRQGLEGLDAIRRIRLNAEPEPPVLIEPAPKALLDEPRPRFRWAQVANAQRYRLEIAATPDFAAPLVDRDALTAPEFVPEQELAVGSWYWRVTAADRDGPGPRGVVQQLRRIPPAPPVGAPQVGDDALTLSWTADAPGSRYRVQVASNDRMNDPLVDEVRDEPAITLPRPAPGRYYTRVRVRYEDGAEGPFGRAQQFDVPEPPASPWWLLLLLLPLVFAL